MDSSIEQMAPELEPSAPESAQAQETPPPPPSAAVVAHNQLAAADARYAAFVPAPEVGTSNTVTNTKSPFYIHTCNHPNHKFKYPETNPTPDNEDDTQWGKIYTAADSRNYNHGNKSAAESKKLRGSGHAYSLALTMLVENKIKYGIAVQNAILRGDSIPTEIPRATPKPYSLDDPIPAPRPPPQPRSVGRMEQPYSESRMGGEVLSISESLKLQGRTARQSSTSAMSTLTNNQNASSAQQQDTMQSGDTSMSSPAVEMGFEAPGPRARTMTAVPGTKLPSAAKRLFDPAKKEKASKKARTDGTPSNPYSKNTHNSSNAHHHPRGTVNVWALKDNGRNDAGEKLYCSCRSPDDRKHMIQCSNAACSEWFHIQCCPGLSVYLAEQVVEYYYCQHCESPEAKTTFKRLCRNHALHVKGPFRGVVVPECLNLARVGETGTIDDAYCSDQHRDEYWQHMFKSVYEDSPAAALGGVLNLQEVANIFRACHNMNDIAGLGSFTRMHTKVAGDVVVENEKDFTKEQIRHLKNIKAQKLEQDKIIALADDQLGLLRLISDRQKAAAKYLDRNVSSICGYDNRLALNDYQFKVYKGTQEYLKALESGKLGPATSESLDILAGKYPVQGRWKDTHVRDYDMDVIEAEMLAARDPDALPDVLNNICLADFSQQIKVKSKCKHNTMGTWWHDRIEHEFRVKKQRATLEKKKLEEMRKDVLDTAAKDKFLEPLSAANHTQVWD